MKRHLNTCYRLVWNHITGAFVVASELARARGKRGGVAVALSLAAVTSLPVLAADIVVHPGETAWEHSLLWRVKLIMSYWKMADAWMC